MERPANGLGVNGDPVATPESIKSFWDTQAALHGTDDTATAPDRAYRELEIAQILRHIRGPRLLDVGCGNGFSTLKLKEAHTDWDITGVDYSAKMIEQAIKADAGNSVNFVVGDVLNLGAVADGTYDCIVSERCIINLLSWDEQRKALLEMKKLLKPGGRIVLVENFEDGLKALNDLRENFRLPPIEQRWHNRYLDYREFQEFALEEFTITYAENIGNLYYIVSRVVYASLCAMMGEEPRYDNPINFIAAGLPTLGNHNFSPNMLIVLENR